MKPKLKGWPLPRPPVDEPDKRYKCPVASGCKQVNCLGCLGPNRV